MTGRLQFIRPWAVVNTLFRKRLSNARIEPPISLDCHMDANPIVIQNDNSNIDSPTVSGSLALEVIESMIELQNLEAVLRVHTNYRKPLKRGCKECKHQFTELKRCKLVTSSITIDKGTYAYPLFYRVPSYIPPSMHTSLVSVTYELEAIASVQRLGDSPTDTETIAIKRTLPIVRAIPITSIQTTSSRIYPMAGIEVRCVFQTVLDTSRKNRATLTMSGLRSSPGNGEEVHIWRVCSGTWMLEETATATVPTCALHSHQRKKNRCQEQKRKSILGDSAFYHGWATDDDAGTMSMDLLFFIRKSLSHYTQDTGDGSDASVSHALVLELQLMKEIFPKGRPDLATRTGIGRIIRSEHRVILSGYTTLSNHIAEEGLPSYNELYPRPPVYGVS